LPHISTLFPYTTLFRSDLKGVHVHSLRLGSLPGEHSIIFSSLEETLEFKHIAHDKHVFAKGAMKASKFIVTKKAGLYNMTDLIRSEEHTSELQSRENLV